MIDFYFTRHPQTGDEVDRIYRGEAAELTPEGEVQMAKVIERLVNIHPHLIVTSSYPRAIRLGQALAAAMGGIVPIVSTQLLAEVRKPSVTLSRNRDTDQLALEAMERVRNPDFFNQYRRFSDEENRNDLEKRFRSALNYLLAAAAQTHATTVAVMTHGKTLRGLKHIIEHEGTLRDFYVTERHLKHDNTGITHFRHGHMYRGGIGWELVTWNSTAHLDPPSFQEILKRVATSEP